MRETGKKSRSSTGDVIAVSGGPDSVYLFCGTLNKSKSAIIAHLNHGARGLDSDKDQEFVEQLGRSKGIRVEVRKIALTKSSTGFEKKARNERYAFLQEVKRRHGAEKILVAHTADDQVETVLMRILEGAGISGLKGIPRGTEEGIERPLLDTWREDIIKHLRVRKIPYRVDRSNVDTRFERNWIRHVLIPLLEKRYGKSLKKRIFTLGERFREIDEFLEYVAHNWLKRNVNTEMVEGRIKPGGRRVPVRDGVRVPRKPYSRLPSVVRKKILQLLCFERVGIAPNERLLEAMDKTLVSGGPSARLNIGKGAVLRCRYDQAVLETGKGGGVGDAFPGFVPGGIVREERGRITPAALRRLVNGERAAAFDAEAVSTPLAVRPLRAGDRIRPFGLDAEKKVKEILIDRKVPRDERWGRPVVCDADGRILWIPGVVRSAHAPVTGKTRRTAVLRGASPREGALRALHAIPE
jgi:tRNA(Ile)-lysidine synthase